MNELDASITEWRTAITRNRAVSDTDADELESHLRDQITELEAAGLDADEAFVIAVKRLGRVDRVSAEYAREHGDRLWQQLTLPPVDAAGTVSGRRRLIEMLAFAVLAAVLIQVARLASGVPDSGAAADAWFARNVGFFVLPVVAGYLAVLRRMPWRGIAVLAAVVAGFAIVVNLYPFSAASDSSTLVAIHLPVVLWFVVAAAYLAGEVMSSPRRIDAVRFTGEWAVYYVLIALGGGVLVGLMVAVLAPIAPDAINQLTLWVIPSGAAGAAVVAAWLVEAKKAVIENIAPVLTAIFTPLFAVLIVVSAIGYLIAGLGQEFDRELLVVFDVLLLVVLGLVLYSLSARDVTRPTPVMDVIRLVAVIAAVVLDGLVLGSMLARIGEYGFTPNRTVALGLNVLLIVNLAVTAVLAARPRADVVAAVRMERWQTAYLPVFGLWAAVVVVVIPPLFGFA